MKAETIRLDSNPVNTSAGKTDNSCPSEVPDTESGVLSCTVVDVGSRYGLHPTWNELRDLVEFHLFEMDVDEARRLSAKYEANPKVHIHPYALYSSEGPRTYYEKKHKALSTFYRTDGDLLTRQKHMVDDFRSARRQETYTRTLDAVFADQPVHFLKIDAEGAELEILKGAERQLGGHVLGVRSEVLFSRIFKAGPLFGDVHEFLLDRGFELINLAYDGRGSSPGRFTLPHRYGRLISSDGVWLKAYDRLVKDSNHRAENVIRAALFLMLNSATDVAVDLLLRMADEEEDYVDRLQRAPLFLKLKEKTAFLFKDLLLLPYIRKEEVHETYFKIFKAQFPERHLFYETFSL
ncbi:MAG: FkbM family methyltransferase [Thermodesulfobacteriota bacterium]